MEKMIRAIGSLFMANILWITSFSAMFATILIIVPDYVNASTTYSVPLSNPPQQGEYPNIQSAINAALNGNDDFYTISVSIDYNSNSENFPININTQGKNPKTIEICDTSMGHYSFTITENMLFDIDWNFQTDSLSIGGFNVYTNAGLSGHYLIDITNSENVCFTDFNVYEDVSLYEYGVLISSSHDISIVNGVINVDNDGIIVQTDSNSIYINNVEIICTDDDGILLLPSTYDIVISECTLWETYYGIIIWDSDYVDISYTAIYDGIVGIDISGGSNYISVDNCGLSTPADIGLSARESYNITVSHCGFYSDHSYDIDLDTCDNVLIDTCSFQSSYTAIRGRYCNNINIVDCDISGINEYGIETIHCNDINIEDLDLNAIYWEYNDDDEYDDWGIYSYLDYDYIIDGLISANVDFVVNIIDPYNDVIVGGINLYGNGFNEDEDIQGIAINIQSRYSPNIKLGYDTQEISLGTIDNFDVAINIEVTEEEDVFATIEIYKGYIKHNYHGIICESFCSTYNDCRLYIMGESNARSLLYYNYYNIYVYNIYMLLYEVNILGDVTNNTSSDDINAINSQTRIYNDVTFYTPIDMDYRYRLIVDDGDAYDLYGKVQESYLEIPPGEYYGPGS